MKMNRVIALAIVSILVVSSILAGLLQPRVVHAQQTETEEPLNQVVLDVTYDPETGTYSLGGLSAEQLKVLGAFDMPQAAWEIASKFDNVSIELNNEELSLATEGEKLASINWDEASRQVLYDLANSYVPVTDASKARVEEWASSTEIVLNFRNSSELSRPLQIELATLLQVDINSNRVILEGFDTGVVLEPTLSTIARTGGVKNTTICWNRGELGMQVNDKNLPAITIHREGLDIINDALGLGLGYTKPYFDAKVGADVSFDGSPHSGIYCDQ